MPENAGRCAAWEQRRLLTPSVALFEVSRRRDSQRSAHSAMLGYGAGAGDGTHGPPHTDQLRRMVAIADRSPARYIFELKLAEMPSGPLNSKLMMFRPRQVTYRGRSRERRTRNPTATVVAF